MSDSNADLVAWIPTVFKMTVALMCGVYSIKTGGGFEISPGGDATVDELRERAARTAAELEPDSAIGAIRIVAQDHGAPGRALVIESYDLPNGTRAAARQPYKVPLMGKRAKPIGRPMVLETPPALPQAGTEAQ